jgi:hypothetical protein
MTEHPCARYSKSTVEVFEAIAINQPPPYRPRAINVLLNAGLIVKIGDRVLRDRFGEIKVPVYEVPLPVHYQWCQWCSENVEDSEIGL